MKTVRASGKKSKAKVRKKRGTVGRKQRTGNRKQIRSRPLVLSSAERTDRINKIRILPELVEAAIAGLNDQQLDTPYRDGGWTVRQVVHHLADSHMNAVVRTRLILAENNPPLKGYDQEVWAELPDVRMPVNASLAIIRGLHARWATLFESIPETAWTRTGLHTENGEMSVEDILITYSHHGENHVGQITGLRAAKNW